MKKLSNNISKILFVFILILNVILILNFKPTLTNDERGFLYGSSHFLTSTIFFSPTRHGVFIEFLSFIFFKILNITSILHQIYLKRLLTVVFSVGVISIIYLFCNKFFNKYVALLSSFLIAINSLFVSLGMSIMLDIPQLFFMLLTFYFYSIGIAEKKEKYFWYGGISLAISANLKLFGFFPLIPILFSYKKIHNRKVFILSIILGLILTFPWLLNTKMILYNIYSAINLKTEITPFEMRKNPLGEIFNYNNLLSPLGVILLAVSVIYLIFHRNKKGFGLRFIFSWLVFYIPIMLYLPPPEASRYQLPALPFYFIIISIFSHDVLYKAFKKRNKFYLFSSFLIFFCLFAFVYLSLQTDLFIIQFEQNWFNSYIWPQDKPIFYNSFDEGINIVNYYISFSKPNDKLITNMCEWVQHYEPLLKNTYCIQAPVNETKQQFEYSDFNFYINKVKEGNFSYFLMSDTLSQEFLSNFIEPRFTLIYKDCYPKDYLIEKICNKNEICEKIFVLNCNYIYKINMEYL